MKYLHVLTAYTIKPQNIMEFINKNFNIENHFFLILADEKYVLKNNPQLIAFDNIVFVPAINKSKKSRFIRAKYLYRVFSKAENIVWHSFLGLKGLQLLLVTYLFRKKIIWIEHGLDLYYWQWKPHNIKNKIAYYLVNKIRQECKNYGVTLLHDKNEIIQRYRYRNENDIFFLPTPFNEKAIEVLKDFVDKKEIKGNGKTTKILVGIDGLKINRHYSIIKRLEHYKSERIACFLPMNYALGYEYGLTNSRKYSTEVIEYGNRVLEKPVIELKKSSVDLNTYFKLLDSMDIAIFNFQRPIYLDMLFYLLYLEKKVYLSSESVVYKSLSEIGLKLFDIEDIGKESFEEIIKTEDLASNRKIIDKITSNEYIQIYWKKCFS